MKKNLCYDCKKVEVTRNVSFDNHCIHIYGRIICSDCARNLHARLAIIIQNIDKKKA